MKRSCGQVLKLYDLVKYSPKDGKQSYKDGWDLRRLYTFTFRRQLDAFKRKQTPRDWHVWTKLACMYMLCCRLALS